MNNAESRGKKKRVDTYFGYLTNLCLATMSSLKRQAVLHPQIDSHCNLNYFLQLPLINPIIIKNYCPAKLKRASLMEPLAGC